MSLRILVGCKRVIDYAVKVCYVIVFCAVKLASFIIVCLTLLLLQFCLC
jgi:hypothetical protein